MDELTTIKFFISDNNGASSAKVKEIEDAVNAITEAKINVHVDLTSSDWASFMNAVPLALASGEQIDVVAVQPVAPMTLSSLYANNQVMDLSPYLEEYGPDILAVAGDYLDAVTINGEICMVPNVRNYAASEYLVMAQEYIDGLGLKEQFDNIETTEDLEAVLKAVTEEYGIPALAGGMSEDARVLVHGSGGMILNANGSFEDSLLYDTGGDNLNVLGIDEETDTVYNIYETQEFIDACKITKEWYEKGYIFKDAAFSSEAQESICKANAAAGIITTGEISVGANKSAAFGKPVYVKKLKDALITSNAVYRFGLSVPSTAAEPEAAVCFINLLMTDSDLNNTLFWGIEGEDWQVGEDGHAEYLPGQDNAEWHLFDFYFGNAYVDTPWSGAPEHSDEKEANDAAEISKYLGFSLDTSNQTNNIAALTSVMNQYQFSLALGLWSEESYDEFIEKMKAAGIDEYLADAQQQLDAWLAEQ